ncbi:MAG: PcfJ domain-containing protein [Lachnospiraceae bacterium]|nr:PcfJ domain-containing protein [Lachnospiraceae bacterium]
MIMKPRNKFQQHVLELSKRLPEITEPQQRWAYKHCFAHIGKRNAKGTITCLECGHSWQGDNSPLADTVLGCKCLNCATRLDIKTTRKRVFKEIEYFGIVTMCGNFQVIRYFHISVYRKAGEQARYHCSEVVQRWLSPNGKEAVIARLRGMSIMYYDLWNFGSKLEIRPCHRAHDIEPIHFYPRQRVISEISRNGFNGEYHDIHPLELFRSILTDNKAETLLKTGQTNLLRYFIRYSSKDINPYWNSIRICIRNGYTIADSSIWCDYIDQLNFFGKDTNSPKYVCPENLHERHDFYMEKKRTHIERQRLEEKRQKAREDEAKFKELKAKFFGIAFTDGTIQVRVLESVNEFMEEGKAMHHCVFDNAYYLKKNSLIFSATIDGKRIETIEISLKTLKVVQSRGVCNQNTEYHDRIIKLVNKNRRLIRKRMAA